MYHWNIIITCFAFVAPVRRLIASTPVMTTRLGINKALLRAGSGLIAAFLQSAARWRDAFSWFRDEAALRARISSPFCWSVAFYLRQRVVASFYTSDEASGLFVCAYYKNTRRWFTSHDNEMRNFVRARTAFGGRMFSILNIFDLFWPTIRILRLSWSWYHSISMYFENRRDLIFHIIYQLAICQYKISLFFLCFLFIIISL